MSELIDRESTVKQICKMGEMVGGHDRDVVISIALFVQDDKTAFPTEERPHGEWIENTRYKRKGKKFLDCSVCHYGENGDIICEVSKLPNFCPNCGASMSANDRQVTGKLNSEIERSKSEIERSKSEIVPDYRDGWRLREGEAE